MSAPTTEKLTCTEDITGFHFKACGRTAKRDKGQNNEPRCGIHSSEAVQRRRDKRRAEQKATEERSDRLDQLAKQAQVLVGGKWNSFTARTVLEKLADEAKP